MSTLNTKLHKNQNPEMLFMLVCRHFFCINFTYILDILEASRRTSSEFPNLATIFFIIVAALYCTKNDLILSA